MMTPIVETLSDKNQYRETIPDFVLLNSSDSPKRKI